MEVVYEMPLALSVNLSSNTKGNTIKTRTSTEAAFFFSAK